MLSSAAMPPLICELFQMFSLLDVGLSGIILHSKFRNKFRMKLFGILAASATAGLIDHPLNAEFNSWKLEHGKVYETAAANAQKFENWLESHKFVLEHNMRYLMNQESFNVELNHMADLTDEEFVAMNNLRNGEAPPPSMCTDAPASGAQGRS